MRAHFFTYKRRRMSKMFFRLYRARQRRWARWFPDGVVQP